MNLSISSDNMIVEKIDEKDEDISLEKFHGGCFQKTTRIVDFFSFLSEFYRLFIPAQFFSFILT
jgi:hypothetical protein